MRLKAPDSDLIAAMRGAQRCPAAHRFGSSRGETMLAWQDLFQWDRFITPTIIKMFYWLAIAMAVLFGISGIFSALALMAINPFSGFPDDFAVAGGRDGRHHLCRASRRNSS
jgi:hypothetical protein